MSKRRSREEIIRQILEQAQGEGTTITRVALKTGLTTSQAQDYLGYMILHELITVVSIKDSGHKVFRTTPKGVRFINIAAAISDLMAKHSLYQR